MDWWLFNDVAAVGVLMPVPLLGGLFSITTGALGIFRAALFRIFAWFWVALGALLFKLVIGALLIGFSLYWAVQSDFVIALFQDLLFFIGSMFLAIFDSGLFSEFDSAQLITDLTNNNVVRILWILKVPESFGVVMLFLLISILIAFIRRIIPGW